MCQILEPVANAFEKNAGHNNLHKHKQIDSHWAIKSFCTVCRCRKAEGALQNVLEVYRVKWITSHACIVDITVRKWLLYCLISNPQKLSIICLEKCSLLTFDGGNDVRRFGNLNHSLIPLMCISGWPSFKFLFCFEAFTLVSLGFTVLSAAALNLQISILC